MQVFDEFTKQWVDAINCRKIVLQHLPNVVIFGYTSRPDLTVRIFLRTTTLEVFTTDLSLFKGELFYSKNSGMYFSPIGLEADFIFRERNFNGNGDFPYLLKRHYEAIESFDIFKNKQVLKDADSIYPISNYLDYTFGLEFETSEGYIPEDKCYRDGLIPLRDGSITGVEYSTIVLKGNKGISLLHQQLETLKEYTVFNKECSLHIHLGGYPLDSKKIYNLYRVCKSLESELEGILPSYTFNSSEYKDNGKDYCKKLKSYSNFNAMYKDLVGRTFFGSFTQSHPDDIERARKWNIQSRYYFVNFINLLCYRVNKTVEFRFLRPTYNFKKILLWLYIFNAILKYSDKYYTLDNSVSLSKIIKQCYPEKLAEELCEGVQKLQIISVNQYRNGDYIGANAWMDKTLNDLNI